MFARRLSNLFATLVCNTCLQVYVKKATDNKYGHARSVDIVVPGNMLVALLAVYTVPVRGPMHAHSYLVEV